MHGHELRAADLDGLTTLSAPEAFERLTAITESLARCDDPARLEALARALPDTVAALAPEVCLALHGLALALVGHRPTIPRDLADLEPRLRVAWRQVELAADASAARTFDEPTLLRVVQGWSPDGVLDPVPLLRRLAAADDARLRALALEWTPPMVRQLAITPALAFTLLAPLAADRDPALRGRALTMLCRGWLRGLAPTAERQRERIVVAALVDSEPTVVHAAITAAAALGRRDWLCERVLAAEGPLEAAADALDALGPLACDADLDMVLALASREPLRFAPVTRRFLLAAHRHGVFVRAPHLDAVLATFAAHPVWTGEELVRVTYIVRAELIERLATLPADDPRWIRGAAILAASFGTRAPVLLRALLEQVHDPAIAEALIDAAGHSPEYVGEEPLLAWLATLPEAVLPVLRVKGGAQARTRLRALVEDPRCDDALRTRALDVLWALSRDRETLLTELSTQLGPHAAGLLGGARLARRDPRIARLVADAPWGDDPEHTIDATRQLEILCGSGDIDHLPRVTTLFRELFRGLVRRALAGDFTIKRVAIPELEQRLYRYGRQLISEGRSVRRWLEPGPETGRDLVLSVAIDWLREGPSDAISVALLELVGRHAPGPATLRFIEPLWRHGDGEVRRAAIEAILAAGEEARGLELSICRLAAQEEPRILCQALTAVATLRAQWAEPIVLAALQRPEMAVKKDAAPALAQIGSERAVATLVEWLGHHDNRGLRSELLAALEHAAGPTMVAVLVAALDDERDPRRVELLWSALSGHLPLAAALRLARSPQPAHQALLAACLDGRVALADGDTATLTTQLHRARLLPPDPARDPGRPLRIDGFSPAAARALVEQRTPELDATILTTVRAGLSEWVAWLRTDDPDPRALALVLDSMQPQHSEHVPALLECVARRLATIGGAARGPAIDGAAVASWLERCVVGRALGRQHEVAAIAIVRALPVAGEPDGLRRYRLLGRLGALRTAADLTRCLATTMLAPDLASASASLFFEALAVPTHRDDEPPELTTLRDEARRWHALPEPRRIAWLAVALATRPLDLPALPTPPQPASPRFQPRSQDDLEALCAALRSGDEPQRSRAAARLLDWPDAQPAWPQVLDALLRGDVLVSAEHRARLAPLLTRWPTEPGPQRIARTLLPHLGAAQHRRLVRAWVEGWRRGDPALTELLQTTPEALLLPLVWSAAEGGDFRLAQLLRPGRSSALRAFLAWAETRSPADVAHLRPAPEATPTPDDTDDPADPLAGRDHDGLLAILADKRSDRGLAVRAVHALVEHGERSITTLAELTTDPRPPVRSAALRALRRVASREQTLESTARALAMETRPDILLQLMKSLGHGRHEPALPALLEHLHHREPRIRQGAHDALRAWGPDIVPTLRRAAHRARPDRRPAYDAVIAALAPDDT